MRCTDSLQAVLHWMDLARVTAGALGASATRHLGQQIHVPLMRSSTMDSTLVCAAPCRAVPCRATPNQIEYVVGCTVCSAALQWANREAHCTVPFRGDSTGGPAQNSANE